jgi:hypothetical protein
MLRKLSRYVGKLGVFLITIALIAGMGGCPSPSQNLEIRTWYDLAAITNNLAGNHILMNDLDSTIAGYTELASPATNQGKGWEPIGFFGAMSAPGCGLVGGAAPWWYGLTGTFDGQGYEIRDLFINRPDECHVSPIGLFGSIDKSGIIKNVGVVNVTVTGCESVGGLAGRSNGTVIDSHSAGSVTGEGDVGGLVGDNHFGTVSRSYSTGTVTGTWGTGGVVGHNWEGTVVSSYFTGNVTGASWVGGLVGYNYKGAVSNSYSTGTIIGGTINGTSGTGGLVGGSIGTVSNSYSTGSISGERSVGGVVGFNGNDGTVSNSYSTGSVTGQSDIGGLVGRNWGTVRNSFWDTETSGQASSDGGMGKTTAEMKNIATFSGADWDIIAVANSGIRNPSCIWNIVDRQTHPSLSWELQEWQELASV